MTKAAKRICVFAGVQNACWEVRLRVCESVHVHVHLYECLQCGCVCACAGVCGEIREKTKGQCRTKGDRE